MLLLSIFARGEKASVYKIGWGGKKLHENIYIYLSLEIQSKLNQFQIIVKHKNWHNMAISQ